MSLSCARCASLRIINLETVRMLGTAAGGLAGSLKSAYVSLYSRNSPINPSTPFPLSRVAAAVVAAATGGITGAAAGHQIVQHIFPPGEGAPCLCVSCGNTFRVLD